jgi:hypothetical protein
MKLTSAYLGHHGLVAGIYDELSRRDMSNLLIEESDKNENMCYFREYTIQDQFPDIVSDKF